MTLATCNNTIGSYTCACTAVGYEGDGFNCTDIDECFAVPCDVNAACNNTEGSFICTCDIGWEGLAVLVKPFFEDPIKFFFWIEIFVVKYFGK